ncbi:hypothetical protein GGR76_001278 [Xanthomonas translucens]|nr:hypothetical protein [Xanthomonas campestris]
MGKASRPGPLLQFFAGRASDARCIGALVLHLRQLLPDGTGQLHRRFFGAPPFQLPDSTAPPVVNGAVSRAAYFCGIGCIWYCAGGVAPSRYCTK